MIILVTTQNVDDPCTYEHISQQTSTKFVN